jgi:hypothetical protein
MKNLNRPTALALAATALLIGAIGPWVTILGLIGAGPTTFTEVWTVVFGAIAVVIASALTGRYMRPVSIVAGVAILSEVSYVWFHLSKDGANELGRSLVQPGWGLYLTTLAALFLIASTWVAKKPAEIKTRKLVDYYGHCDTCGDTCDENGCTTDHTHLAAVA